MFTPARENAKLNEEVSTVLAALHRAAFEDGSVSDMPDALLAVPVRLIPFVQRTRSMRKALGSLRERCELLQIALDANPVPLVMVAPDRTVLIANAAARAHPGAQPQATFSLGDATADADLEAALASLRTGIRCARPPAGVREVRLARVAGRQVIVLMLVPPSGG